jgi:hypothetical protein
MGIVSQGPFIKGVRVQAVRAVRRSEEVEGGTRVCEQMCSDGVTCPDKLGLVKGEVL